LITNAVLSLLVQNKSIFINYRAKGLPETFDMSFCRNLKLASSEILFLTFLMLAIAVSGAWAQSEPQTVRRNSPFAPNPKKRVEQSNSAAPKIDSVKIAEVSETANPAVENSVNENNAPSTEIATNSEVLRPGTSIAAKTLEIAKRASVLNVLPTEVYKIGSGDILFISLQNAPAKETNYFTVLKDGTIDYPLAGEMIPVAGMTTEEVEDTLKEKIKLYENPQVSVKIREYNSHVYTVLGLVEKSGEKNLQREAIPLFVVRAESIVDPKADRVTIKRSNSDAQTIDLKDAKADETLIYAGDIVEFSAVTAMVETTVKASQFYYIGGEIVTGGQKDFVPGITLTQAILAANGLKKATVRKVIIRRKDESGMLKAMQADLKSIKDGRMIDPVIEVGDTIEVGN
jgi:protein involved in polysaccharide export with SLBB domain